MPLMAHLISMIFSWYKEIDDIINEFKANDSITKEEIEYLLSKTDNKEKIGSLISQLLEKKIITTIMKIENF